MPRRRSTSQRPPRTRRWSAEVNRRSNALDLESHVFKKRSPRAIALSLKRSAEHSRRRKARPFASAMSMLNFYINRAGRGLRRTEKVRLQRAKDELRSLFGRPAGTRARAGGAKRGAGRSRP